MVVFVFTSNCEAGSFLKAILSFVSERGTTSWKYETVSVTKQNKNAKHSPTELTPNQASIKRNEEYVYWKFLDYEKRIKLLFKIDIQLERRKKRKNSYRWFYKVGLWNTNNYRRF